MVPHIIEASKSNSYPHRTLTFKAKMTVKGTPVATGRKKLGTIIGDYAQIGVQVSIMPGKTIGSYALVGSNTIVSENIPSYHRYYSKSTTHLKLRK